MRASACVCVPCVHICVCVRVEEVGGSDGVCGGGGGGGGGAVDDGEGCYAVTISR